MNFCKQCQSPFKITQEDLQFYDKISPIFGGKKYSVPPPTLCPDCRAQRKMIWRNERKLFRRKCDLCQKEIVSCFNPESEFKIFCPSCYHSDQWDPMAYGKTFDSSRPFFDQFEELLRQTPTLSLNVDNNINCEFTNQTSFCKDSYLIFAGTKNEDCFNSLFIQFCRNVADCFFTFRSELCFECVDCYDCYHVLYSQGCHNCRESQWLFNCRGCSDCLGCVNLNNKQYHIFNKSYSKDEYLRKRDEILSDPEKMKQAQQVFHELVLASPHKYYSGVGNEFFTGDHISFSKNAYDCYDSNNLENCRRCTWFVQGKDSQDCYAWGINSELGYENITCGDGFFHVLFSESCWGSVADLYYSEMCLHNSHDLFGCVGLRKKSHCILNRQYSKEEYEALVPRIIEHMVKTGEWGEFFPARLAFFPYSQSIAQEFYPLSKKEALQKGFAWSDYEMPPTKVVRVISREMMSKLPVTIKEIPDDIVNWALTCETCGKPFKLITQELAFYRKLKVPVPKKCFNCRHEERNKCHNPRHLWLRNCANCKKPIQTTYSPDRPEIVYCEQCYLKEVY